MTNDNLSPHLEAIGRQLTNAAHRLASPPRRSRQRPLRLVAASTTALAAIVTAAVLALGATTGTPPAFAVTRLHDRSASLKINRRTSITDVNRKLAAMGIEPIGRGATATGDDMSSIPNCSSIPPGWKGAWVQITAPATGTTIWTDSLPPGSWLHVFCLADNPGYPGSGNAGTTGNTRNTGNTGNTGAG
jgi:hypothetical protein